MSKRYPGEQRERAMKTSLTPRRIPLAVRCVQSNLPEAEAEAEAGALRTWTRQVLIDADTTPGVTTDEQCRIKELERELRKLREVNEILKSL